MLTTRFFKAIADGNPAAIASLLAPLAFGPAGFIVPIVTVASTLTADAAVAATRSVSAHRKRKADQGELDRKRRHELQMQRERIAAAERVEAAKPKPKSALEIRAERAKHANDVLQADLAIAALIKEEEIREIVINNANMKFHQRLAALMNQA